MDGLLSGKCPAFYVREIVDYIQQFPEPSQSIEDVGVIAQETDSAILFFRTTRNSTSYVNYGETASYGQLSYVDEGLVKLHGIRLSGLTENTTYHYSIVATDEDNTRVTSNGTFTTKFSISTNNIYVATDGNDSNDGTIGSPLLTINQARQNAIALTGKVTVWLREGTYYQSSTLAFTSADTRTEASEITYQSYPGETARISGGKEVTGWTLVVDAGILARLPAGADGNVYQCDLTANGISDYGDIARAGFGYTLDTEQLELFFKDSPMTLARWPNNGTWLLTTGVPGGVGGDTFTYSGANPDSWASTDDVWVHGYFYNGYLNSRLPVTSIASNTVTVGALPTYGFDTGRQFYFLNILEELSEAGEYYLDRATGILYFWPTDTIGGANKTIVSMLETDIMTVTDVEYTTFKGIIFENSRSRLVTVTGGSNVCFDGCTFRNSGTSGLYIINSPHSGVMNSGILDTGEYGVRFESEDRATLTPSYQYAVNNVFRRNARIARTNKYPIYCKTGAGRYFAYNDFADIPAVAIGLSACNNILIEYNLFDDVVNESGDSGVIYGGKDWTIRGVVVKNNTFQNIVLNDQVAGLHINGVYIDDNMGGMIVYGNLFNNVHNGVQIHGGSDNKIINNVFYNMGESQIKLQQSTPDMSAGAPIILALAAVPYNSGEFLLQYPEIENVTTDVPWMEIRNEYSKNVLDGGENYSIIGTYRSYRNTNENNFTGTADFIDAANGDFELPGDSDVWGIRFIRIPFERIGNL